MSSLAFKVNFILRGSDFLEKTFQLERLLSKLGSMKVLSKDAGIAQYSLETKLNKNQVDQAVTARGLRRKAFVSIAEEENGEMETA